MKYENEITNIIKNTINLTTPIEDIGIDENFENMGMDSISFIRIVVEIEEQLGIEFPEEKLLLSQAGTIRFLCEIVMAEKDGNITM